MELQGLPNVCAYLLIIDLRNIDAVLSHLQEAGIRLKLRKCSFMLLEVKYLGPSKGLHPTQEKIKAIQDAPTTTNVSQLRSFLGLLNYHGKFLHNLSTDLASLYQAKVPWT